MENGGYEVGKRYLSYYWRREFTVIKIHGREAIPWSEWAVTVQWEDGHYTTHCTPRTKKDVERGVGVGS